MLERLQKLIAQAGLCSRRHAEELITSGRVMVNGTTILQLGSKADPEQDSIKVDGKRLEFSSRKSYFLLNKPKGYLCTQSDPNNRPLALSLIREGGKKLFTVGRLDMQTEGLILVTNDGDFAQKVSSAGEHCPKTYLVKVQGNPVQEAIERLSKGIVLDGVQLAPCRIQKVKEGENPWYSVVLIEGKNNQIRRMFEQIHCRVSKLKRVQIGFLRDAGLTPGDYRPLTPQEVQRFLQMKEKQPGLHPETDSIPSPVRLPQQARTASDLPKGKPCPAYGFGREKTSRPVPGMEKRQGFHPEKGRSNAFRSAPQQSSLTSAGAREKQPPASGFGREKTPRPGPGMEKRQRFHPEKGRNNAFRSAPQQSRLTSAGAREKQSLAYGFGREKTSRPGPGMEKRQGFHPEKGRSNAFRSTPQQSRLTSAGARGKQPPAYGFGREKTPRPGPGMEKRQGFHPEKVRSNSFQSMPQQSRLSSAGAKGKRSTAYGFGREKTPRLSSGNEKTPKFHPEKGPSKAFHPLSKQNRWPGEATAVKQRSPFRPNNKTAQPTSGADSKGIWKKRIPREGFTLRTRKPR
jgi:23S rRNA pseudouridine2605 synthase